VGTIPSGLPNPQWVAGISGDAITSNITDALIIALVAFIEAIAVAKKFAG